MYRGYIKLWRRTRESKLWLDEKFTRGQAWVDLLMLTNHEDGHIRKRGIPIEVHRGEIGWSEEALSERWKWSRGKVRRFLAELSSKTVQQIEQQKTNVTSLIKVTNWEVYQGNGTPNDTASDTANGHQTDTKRYRKKNDKNEKKEKNKEECPFVLPDWVPIGPWNSFLEMRVRIRKPLTDNAKSLAIQKLLSLKESGQDPTEVLNQSVFNSYQGLFPKKEYSDGKSKSDSRPDGPFSRFIREKTGPCED